MPPRPAPPSDLLLGATSLSQCSLAGVAFFLDDGLPPMILVRFDGRAPLRRPWDEFSLVAAGFDRLRETLDQPVSFSGGSPQGSVAGAGTQPGPIWPRRDGCPADALILESGLVKVNWYGRSLTLSPADVLILADLVVAAGKKARSLIERRLEREKLLRDDGGPPVLTWLLPGLFLLAAGLDLLLFCGMFFTPRLFLPWSALSVLMAGSVLLVRRQTGIPGGDALRRYVNEDLLAGLRHLPVSRRTVEFFLIIFFAALYFVCFGAEAFDLIVGFYRSLWGG